MVLVVNARGAALSVVAAAEGFLHFAPDNGILGVILNGCSAMSYGAAGAGAGKPAGRPRLRLSAPAARVHAGEPPSGAGDSGRGGGSAGETAAAGGGREKTLELDALLEIAR